MKEIIEKLEKILEEVRALEGKPITFGLEAEIEDKTEALYKLLF